MPLSPWARAYANNMLSIRAQLLHKAQSIHPCALTCMTCVSLYNASCSSALMSAWAAMSASASAINAECWGYLGRGFWVRDRCERCGGVRVWSRGSVGVPG